MPSLYASAEWKVLQHYISAGSLSFIDLFFAERVLKRLGSPDEAHAALLSVLFALSRRGHLVLDMSEQGLLKTWEALEVGAPAALEALLKEGVQSFPIDSGWVVQKGTRFYLHNNWVYESQVLFHLDRLNQTPPALALPSSVEDPALNAEQTEAIRKALHYSVSFLTGGPGTGKTFTAAHLVKTCLSTTEQLRVVLMAPTGKAAFQLEASLRRIVTAPVQMRVGTIHALLGVNNNPLFADLILIDESSMIDVRLFARLLGAIHAGARVVFIGDKHQLPPVEAGSVFADLLESKRYSATELTTCLRCDATAILPLAQAIREGNTEQALFLLSASSAWIDLEAQEPERVLSALWEHAAPRWMHFFSEKPSVESLVGLLGRFALLSCVRNGPLGVDAVNAYCLRQLRSRAGSASWMAIPLLITANDAELGLYNGDQGILCCKTSSDPLSKQFDPEDVVVFADRTFSAEALASFALSYCVSVHKSQGSEYADVIILAPPGSERFGREVLYTAITRAKQSVKLASTQRLTFEAIGSSSRKQSGICQGG